MPLFSRAVATIAMARAVARHPLVRAGIAAAPKIVTPEVQAKARDVAMDAAYGAGAMTRKLLGKVHQKR